MIRDICEVTYIHEDKVNRAEKDFAKQDPMDVTEVSKTLSDNTRVRTAYILSLEGELCVCDVANIVEPSVVTASRHLRLLKSLGMAKCRKEGKVIHYSLNDEHAKRLVEKSFLYQREVASIG